MLKILKIYLNYHKYNTLLSLQTSPSALYEKASLLDLQAHNEKSNSLLEQSISIYVKLISLGSTVPQLMFKNAAERCSDLMNFRGWTHKAIQVQKIVVQRFPNSPEALNRLGYLYFLSEKKQPAVEVFSSVLHQFPGFQRHFKSSISDQVKYKKI